MILTPFNSDRRVFGGCDLSSTTDLTAFAMVQRREDQGWNCNWLFWMPEESAAKAERKDSVPYQRWEHEGFVRFTPRSRINHEIVKRDIVDCCVEHDISQIGYDPWNAEWLQAQLEMEGIETVQIRQGYASLSEPSKHLEASVADGSFKHGGNPVARWMAENVEIQEDVNRNIRPVKPTKSTKRIDGVVAAVMAIAVAILCPDDMVGSALDEPGGLWL